MKRKILLNPGPATTSDAVKAAQVVPDICPRVEDFGILVRGIRDDLTKIATKSIAEYTTVLFGGSGTAGMESMICSIVPQDRKLLIINNGAYGKRMIEMAQTFQIPFVALSYDWDKLPDMDQIENALKKDPGIACVAAVHHETTSGILNPIKEIGTIAKKYGCMFAIDAVSSFAGIVFDMKDYHIDFLLATSGKCIQGMAGLAFITCRKESLEKIKTFPKRAYYLDLYSQYRTFEDTKQMRFTPPVQTLYALRKAIDEFFEEGTVQRQARYVKNWSTLTHGLKAMGFRLLLHDSVQSKILTTVLEPKNKEYNFNRLHEALYGKDFTIYPGKIGILNTFRLANIGAINHKDIENFLTALKVTLQEQGIHHLEY